jgi:hypothetical protein
MVFTLERFDIEADLDEALFSLEMPAGYTLSELKTLQDVEFGDQSSDEARKIAEAFQLWTNGQDDEALGLILSVDWDEPITFAEEPYIFTLTERAMVEFEKAERDRLMPIVLDSCSQLRKICLALVDRAKQARSAQDYAKAEVHLTTALHLGELANRDPEGMFIVQLVGIAARKLSLVQLKSLYEEMNAPEKLVVTEQKIQQVDADHQRLVKKNGTRQ